MMKVFAMVFLIASVGIAYSLLSRTVLYSHRLPGEPTGEPELIVLNPVRDRSQEKVADSFLQMLKEGRCQEAFALLPEPQNMKTVCEKEKEYPLKSWQLANWTSDSSKVRAYYKVQRYNYQVSYGQLWITLEKNGEQWNVTKYECWY